MSGFFFPDNTVLVNFGHIDRFGTLRTLLDGRGRWCATVAQECQASAAIPGLQSMSDAFSLFGEAERPSQVELIDTRVLREQMAAPGDGAYAHLGEAETVAIMSRRFTASYFVTDDAGAVLIARAEGLKVISTWDLLRATFRAGLLTEDQLWADLEALRSEGRGHPPGVYGYTSFKVWLTGN